MILAQVILEWSTIGIICGLVSMLVGAIVTLSTAYLKLFMSNQLLEQSATLKKYMEDTFIRKEIVDTHLIALEERIKSLKQKAGQR